MTSLHDTGDWSSKVKTYFEDVETLRMCIQSTARPATTRSRIGSTRRIRSTQYSTAADFLEVLKDYSGTNGILIDFRRQPRTLAGGNCQFHRLDQRWLGMDQG